MRVLESNVTMTDQELRGVPEDVLLAGERVLRAYPVAFRGGIARGVQDVYVSFHDGSDNRKKAKFTKYLKSLGAHIVYAEKNKMTGSAAVTFGAMRVLKQIDR